MTAKAMEMATGMATLQTTAMVIGMMKVPAMVMATMMVMGSATAMAMVMVTVMAKATAMALLGWGWRTGQLVVNTMREHCKTWW